MKSKHLTPVLGALVLSLLLVPEALAQDLNILPARNVIPGMDLQQGRVSVVHFPALIMYWIQMLLSLAGGFAVIMIMVGGVQYMIGSVSNDKEQGKKTITYALSGLALAFFAWWIVELIQVWLTS